MCQLQRKIGVAAIALGLSVLVSCASESGGKPERERAPERDGRPGLCSRDRDDAVRDVFCAPSAPRIRSLEDLQEHLALQPDQQFYSAEGETLGGDKFVTLLGHSTALSGHLVSPINPRLLVLGSGTFMAFQRGVQKVEVIASARDAGFLNFYLIEFEQACNRRSEGCTSGDLYTPRIERDWLSVSVRDDEDLKNTPADCRQCHQRASETPRFLMRELNNPWTHFIQPPPANPDQFVGPGVQGKDLLDDYTRAKGDERYGGFALQRLVPLAPFLLETLVGPDQPVLFDAPGIENERWPYRSDSGYAREAGRSPTWEAAYEAFKRGEQPALPYIEPRPTDPDKHAQHSEAYARYRAGEISEDELPDISDIFPDDPSVRARIGLQTEPDASAVEALIQACGGCHNDVLDQEISRARFNVDLWRHDPAEIAVAIERLERSATDPGVMPPAEARQLDPRVRQTLLEYLRSDPLSGTPDPRLERAAELGMSGGANRRSMPR